MTSQARKQDILARTGPCRRGPYRDLLGAPPGYSCVCHICRRTDHPHEHHTHQLVSFLVVLCMLLPWVLLVSLLGCVNLLPLPSSSFGSGGGRVFPNLRSILPAPETPPLQVCSGYSVFCSHQLAACTSVPSATWNFLGIRGHHWPTLIYPVPGTSHKDLYLYGMRSDWIKWPDIYVPLYVVINQTLGTPHSCTERFGSN